MRRRPGLAGLQNRRVQKDRFVAEGTELQEAKMENMKTQLESFRGNLETFAIKYQKKIANNPEFRRYFQQLCNTIGVDPLASSKGYWSNLLGVGEFYYTLGIQVAEVCLVTRTRNGGLIDINELQRRVVEKRGKKADPVTVDDIVDSVKKLGKLGGGYTIFKAGGRKILQSVPLELNLDHSQALAIADDNGGFITMNLLEERLQWDKDRCETSIQQLMQEGILWVDQQAEPHQFWVPAFVEGL
eukprot:Clim_evm16s153 gene=Clim_evmTU16s153